MRFLAIARRGLAGVWLPVCSLCLIAYFAYHAVEGEHGLISRGSLLGEIDRASATLDGLTAERAGLQRRADLLNHEHLDRDLLEEQLRTTMNYVHPDDVILYGDPLAAPAAR